jgi:DNA-binding CsgD family transcriptional regulator
MVRLGSRDLRATLDFLRNTYALRDLKAFEAHILSTLPSVVASEHASYNEINPRAGHYSGISAPPVAPRLLEAFTRHMPEHPLIAHYARTADGRTLKISDFLSAQRFHRLGLYSEFFRQMRIEHQIAFVLPAPPPLVVGVALNRRRPDFSERDRLVLNLLRPHLIQAYRNAEAVTRLQQEVTLVERGIAELGGAIVLLHSDGRVREMTPLARQWLSRYFQHPSPRGNGLPEALVRWVKQQERLLADQDDVPSPQQSLVVTRDPRRLIARLLVSSDRKLLLMEEQGVPEPHGLEALGLTRREAEVLAWVSQGKTNAEVAIILGTRRRTVSKQLEHIYQKLGVETRTAAAALAIAYTSRAPHHAGIL